MTDQSVPEAWVTLPNAEELYARMQSGSKTGYNFGFATNMSRLLISHKRLGATFRNHFAEVMFAPGFLDRREKELVAGAAASAQDCHY